MIIQMANFCYCVINVLLYLSLMCSLIIMISETRFCCLLRLHSDCLASYNTHTHTLSLSLTDTHTQSCGVSLSLSLTDTHTQSCGVCL